MQFEEAVRTCHVRSAIRQLSWPIVLYWKDDDLPFDERVPILAQSADDWEETFPAAS